MAVLGVVVPAVGSLVLGLALLGGARVENLVACATVDEREPMAVWGQDTEVTDRIARMQMELDTSARFEALAQQGSAFVPLPCRGVFAHLAFCCFSAHIDQRYPWFLR